MIIKKYLVSNMNEAMTRIRYELGKDAIIVSQRKVRKPGITGFFSERQLEVTAAVENFNKKEDDFKDSIKEVKKIMEREMEPKPKEIKLEEEVKEMKVLLSQVIKNTQKEEEVDELSTLFEDFDIDNCYKDELKEKINEENLLPSLKEALGEGLKVINRELKGRVVLVGPTGVGKTTTIAKLAGKLSLVDKKTVGLITVDTYRIGAVEQLKTYAEIMNLPFKVVVTIKEMEEAIKEMEHLDVVLIDTTGRSSKNTMQLSELRAFVKKANPDIISMVVSSTTKNRDLETILDGYRELCYDNIIVTKLDETTAYGGLYNISKKADVPFSYITVGQNVPHDIKIPTKDDILSLIFKEESLC